MIPEPAKWPLPSRIYAQETWLKWLCALGFDRVPLPELEAMSAKGSLLESCQALIYADRRKGGDD